MTIAKMRELISYPVSSLCLKGGEHEWPVYQQ